MNSLGATRLDHVSVLITDVGRARQFYGTTLGLREIAPPRTFDFVVVWYDLGGTYLHLLLKSQPDSLSARHFCLHVADARAAREFLAGRGVPTEETVPIPGADRFFIRDPDGNRIEILHWERTYEPDRDGNYRA